MLGGTWIADDSEVFNSNAVVEMGMDREGDRCANDNRLVGQQWPIAG
jgi:hypothetical protein